METLRTAEQTPSQRFEAMWSTLQAIPPADAEAADSTERTVVMPVGTDEDPKFALVTTATEPYMPMTRYPFKRTIYYMDAEGSQHALTDISVKFAGTTPDVYDRLVRVEAIVAAREE